MDEQHVTFDSDGLRLEGLLAKPQSAGGSTLGAVVCHPHPLYGGSMYNNVVDAILAGLWTLNYATLRFNFRGVENSAGIHSGGEEEPGDAISAMRFLADSAGLRAGNIVLAGYSFGAMVAMRAASELEQLPAVLTVALPLGMTDPAEFTGLDRRVALIAGDRDPVCPLAQLEELHGKLGADSSLRVIRGADHFFAGYERDVASAVSDCLRSILPDPR